MGLVYGKGGISYQKKKKKNGLSMNGWENQQPSEKNKLISLLPEINLRGLIIWNKFKVD